MAHSYGNAENRVMIHELAAEPTCRPQNHTNRLLLNWERIRPSETHELLRECCRESAPDSWLCDPDDSQGESGVEDSASLQTAICLKVAGAHPITDSLMRGWIQSWTPVCRPKSGIPFDVRFSQDQMMFDFMGYRLPQLSHFDPKHLRGIILRKFAEMAFEVCYQVKGMEIDYLVEYREAFQYELNEARSRGVHHPLPILNWADEWVHLVAEYFKGVTKEAYSPYSEFQFARWNIIRSSMIQLGMNLRARPYC
jgi:hypothetical protein